MNSRFTPSSDSNDMAASTAQELKSTLLATAAVVVFGLILALGAAWRYEEKIASRQQDLSRFKQSQQQIARLTQDVEQAVIALPGYRLLESQGSIGLFAKAREADRFETTVTGHPAGVRSFSLGAFEPLAAPVDLPLPGLSLGRHELTFDAKPSHEIHLLSLLDALKQSLGGMPLLRSCSVTRSLAGESSATIATSLRSRCSIDWYLFDRKANAQTINIGPNEMMEPI